MRDLIPSPSSDPSESVRYVARPGIGALPAGAGVGFAFAAVQLLLFAFFLWAVWWPGPSRMAGWVFSILLTIALVGLAAGMIAMLLRGNLPIAIGIVRAPFIRLTVTDRRVLWTLPWSRAPLMEIGGDRIRGGLLGQIDRHGRGNAVILLIPGDHAGDEDGHIHIDRLPEADRFVEALRRLS